MLVAACAAVLAADDRTDEVVKLLAPLRESAAPGCAIGVMQSGRFLYKTAFGEADVEAREPLGTSTAFNVASMSKQFTAAAIYFLIESGKARLSDPVRQYVPELPAYAGGVTLDDLLHHTSGLRDIAPLLEIAGRREESLDVARSLRLLSAQTSLNFSPGAEYEYTNADYLLLGLVVERASGEPLAAYAERKIFAPLGMTNTQFYGQFSKLQTRAAGYALRGSGFRKISTPQLVAGDGGLYTSVEDLLRWDENFTTGVLGGPNFVAFMTARGRLRSGEDLPYAAGLIMGRFAGLPAVSHPGELPGYRSELIRFPMQHLSVAALCNRSDRDSPVLARSVAAVFLQDKLRRPRGPAAVNYPSSGFPELDGVWESKQGWLIRAWSAADGLWVDTGEGEYKLYPFNQRQLFADTGTNRLMLTKTSRDEISLAWDRFPRTVYHRLEAPLPTAEDAPLYTGDFTNGEAGARYRIVLDSGRLWIAGAAAWNVLLEPVGGDRFLAGTWSLHFLRTGDGRVTGLQLHCPRLWNLEFTKSPDVVE